MSEKKTVQDVGVVTIEHISKSYMIYQMASMTLNIEYLNDPFSVVLFKGKYFEMVYFSNCRQFIYLISSVMCQ